MGFEIVFRKRAVEELENAYAYYEKEKFGLGIKFVKEVESFIATLEQNPKACRIIAKKYRIVVLRKFPFVIFFTIDKESVIVLNIFHTKRKPLKKYI